MYIRDGKLNCTGIMRSNDIWLGTPYDITFFTELQKYIAHRVGVEYGTYTHFVTSIHAYDRNFQDIKEVLTRNVSSKLTVDIEKLDRYKQGLDYMICNSATPKDDVIRLFEEYEICKEVLV